MRIFAQLIVIFTISLIAVGISAAVPIGIPASIIGMLLLLTLLIFKLIRPNQIGKVSDFFINHLSFFFIPSGVGLIKSFPLISGKLFSLLIICTLNTLITFIATLYSVKFTIMLLKRRKRHD